MPEPSRCKQSPAMGPGHLQREPDVHSGTLLFTSFNHVAMRFNNWFSPSGHKTDKLLPLLDAGNFAHIDKGLKTFIYQEPRMGEHRVYPIGDTDIIQKMETDGYAPATYTELVIYATRGWDGKSNIVALGSITGNPGLTEPHIYQVPALIGREGSKDFPSYVRRLELVWASGWGDGYLAVKK